MLGTVAYSCKPAREAEAPHRLVRRACCPDSLAYFVSSRLMGDPISKGRGLGPEENQPRLFSGLHTYM